MNPGGARAAPSLTAAHRGRALGSRSAPAASLSLSSRRRRAGLQLGQQRAGRERGGCAAGVHVEAGGSPGSRSRQAEGAWAYQQCTHPRVGGYTHPRGGGCTHPRGGGCTGGVNAGAKGGWCSGGVGTGTQWGAGPPPWAAGQGRAPRLHGPGSTLRGGGQGVQRRAYRRVHPEGDGRGSLYLTLAAGASHRSAPAFWQGA